VRRRNSEARVQLARHFFQASRVPLRLSTICTHTLTDVNERTQAALCTSEIMVLRSGLLWAD
jgi:hypothetical protein